MGRALRKHRNDSRRGDRIPLHARMLVATRAGKVLTASVRCTEIGLGGLRATAAEGLKPGTPVRVEVRLPSGRVFASFGHVAWCRQTLHPSLFGAPTGREDDAIFGIAFDDTSPEDLLPIARLFSARERETLRARRIRRIHGLPIHA